MWGGVSGEIMKLHRRKFREANRDRRDLTPIPWVEQEETVA
jgi:hypothetical protein